MGVGDRAFGPRQTRSDEIIYLECFVWPINYPVSFAFTQDPKTMRNITLKAFAAAALLSFVSIATHAQDAYLENLSLPRFIKANTNYTVKVNAKNNASVPLPSFQVRWRVDGGAWSAVHPVNVASPGLQNGGYYITVNHNSPLNVAVGPHTLEVEILSSSDSNPANNTITAAFTALTNWAPKVVLLEGRTETWCQYCPNANTIANSLAADPKYAIAKFHTNDGLAVTDGTSYYNTYYHPTFTPAAVLDMGEYGGYTVNSAANRWSDEMLARTNGVAPASLAISSQLGWSNRSLTVNVTANFKYALTGNFKLNVYVLEDDVPGPQTNAPANYRHNQVVRALLGGPSGTSGVIPNNPVVGTNYTKTYTYTVPATYKLGDLKLIAVLEHAISNTNRYCLNAANGTASPVGIEELALPTMQLQPNPFTDHLHVTIPGATGKASAEMFTMDGRLVLQRETWLDGQGHVQLQFGDLPAGVYVLRVIASAGMAQRTVVKQE